MPDLEQHAVTDWLVGLRPPSDAATWPLAIRPTETAADNPSRLQALGQQLDDIGNSLASPVADLLRIPALLDDLRAIVAQLGAARSLRIMHWFAEMPDGSLAISALIDDNALGSLAARATLSALIRHAQLRRIFAADRVGALQTACEAALREPV